MYSMLRYTISIIVYHNHINIIILTNINKQNNNQYNIIYKCNNKILKYC